MKMLVAALLAAGIAGPVAAQNVVEAATPPAQSAAAPAAPAIAPICTDRPTKANVVCTVPTGSVQIEADAIN